MGCSCECRDAGDKFYHCFIFGKGVTMETENEESSSSSLPEPERVACGPEGAEEESEMDSVFFEVGRGRIFENFTAGMCFSRGLWRQHVIAHHTH